MKFKVQSMVTITGVGLVKHEHTQEFDDDSNVFGRVLEYHQYMYKTFPGCKFVLMQADLIK